MMRMLMLAAATFDAGQFLVEQAVGLGGDVSGLLIKAVGAGASLYVAKVGAKKVIQKVKDSRTLDLPRPVGTRAGYQAVSESGRRFGPKRSGVWSASAQISSKVRAAKAGGYASPSQLGHRDATWGDFERRQRKEAADRLRRTRAYRYERRKAGAKWY